MKTVLGLVMILVGVACGLYMGVWWAFIGGITQIVIEIRAEHLEPMSIAIGVAKVVFAGLIGWASALLLIIPGYIMLNWE